MSFILHDAVLQRRLPPMKKVLPKLEVSTSDVGANLSSNKQRLLSVLADKMVDLGRYHAVKVTAAEVDFLCVNLLNRKACPATLVFDLIRTAALIPTA